jgi:hypothetical protein
VWLLRRRKEGTNEGRKNTVPLFKTGSNEVERRNGFILVYL